jgi:dihydroflavonol-4-reductase
MVRALVTGSTGFVGSSLVAALNDRNIEVLGLRRDNSPDDAVEGLILTPVVGDILDPPSLPRAMEGVDWVFHVAAVSDHRRTGAAAIYKVNIDGAKNVFEAAKQAGVKRVIFTSSSAALGVPRPGKPLMDEEDRFNLKPEEFPYGYSKHRAEEIMAEYVDQGLDIVSVLPAAIMGPRDLKFISGELIIQALKGGIPALPKGGLNYIDVRDCVNGQIAAAERGRCGERYLLSGQNMTHRELMQIFNSVLGTKVPPVDVPVWALPVIANVVGLLHRLGVSLPVNREALMMGGRYLYYNNAKAVQELGLQTRPFSQSVCDSYRWYVAHDYLQKRGISASKLPVLNEAAC